MSEPLARAFSFSVEHAVVFASKGVFVTGECRGGPARVGDRVRFCDPEGAEHEVRVLSVVGRVADKDGRPLEGKSGLVIEEFERRSLRPPLVLTGLSAAGKPHPGAGEGDP